MKTNILPLTAALLFFCVAPFLVVAQEAEERIESGRFGAEEPFAAAGAGSAGKTYQNQWLFLGARLGPPLRLYTPAGDTAFTGGDNPGLSLDMGIQASVQITPLVSIQAEAVFTWDKASEWEYTYSGELDRHSRQFSSFSLQLPLLVKLNFYPGKFRVSPFLGGYVLVPLGKMKIQSFVGGDRSLPYSFSLPLGLLGGISASYALGPGMVFADIRYAADLGEAVPQGTGGAYRRNAITVTFGYEWGFFEKQYTTGKAK